MRIFDDDSEIFLWKPKLLSWRWNDVNLPWRKYLGSTAARRLDGPGMTILPLSQVMSSEPSSLNMA